MSRPQGVKPGNAAGHRIDATIAARAGTTVERTFTAADLPRLRDAGARDGSKLTVQFQFSEFEGRVAIDGELNGAVVLICQRCMRPVAMPLQEQFQVLVTQNEAELDQEPGGYEAILADPARFDLLALTEDQALLALPLVPRHESEECSEAGVAAPEERSDEETRQRPFGNLRDLLRKQ